MCLTFLLASGERRPCQLGEASAQAASLAMGMEHPMTPAIGALVTVFLVVAIVYFVIWQRNKSRG